MGLFDWFKGKQEKNIIYVSVNEVSVIIRPKKPKSSEGKITFYDLSGNRISKIPRGKRDISVDNNCYLGLKKYNNTERWEPVNPNEIEQNLDNKNFVLKHSLSEKNSIKSNSSNVKSKSIKTEIGSSKFGLTKYRKGHYSKIIESKDKLEVYNKFGINGVVVQSMMFSHFKTLDFVSQYFENGKCSEEYLSFIKKNTIHIHGFRHQYTEELAEKLDPFTKYTLSDLPKLLSDKKLLRSTDVTLNFQEFLNNTDRVVDELILTMSKDSPPIEDFIYIKNKGDIFKYLLELKDFNELKNISKEIVGFNSMYLINPLTFNHLRSIDGKTFYAFTGAYVGHNIGWSFNEIAKYSYWRKNIYLYSYEFYINQFLENFIELKLDSIDYDKTLGNFKKQCFKLIKNDKEKSKDFSKIFSHINNLIEKIRSLESLVKMSNEGLDIGGYGGYLKKQKPMYFVMNYSNSLFIELEIVINVCGLMIDGLEDENEFLYSELYHVIEPYKVFSTTVEKEMSDDIKTIVVELEKVNTNLIKINNSVINGLNTVTKQMVGINNKLFLNNIISIINTYQNYKINKNTKSLK